MPPPTGPIQYEVPASIRGDFEIQTTAAGDTLVPKTKEARAWVNDQLGLSHINSQVAPTYFLDNTTNKWFVSFTRTGETAKKQLPPGFYYSDDEARSAAEAGGLRGPRPLETEEFGVIDQLPAEYEILVKNGLWTFAKVGEKKEADKRYSVQIDRTTGDLIRVDLDAEPVEGVLPSTIISKAPTKPLVGWKKIASKEPIDLGNGKFLHAYEVTASDGTTSIKYVTTEDPDPREIGESDITLGDGKGDLIYLGDGRYEHVPDIEDPFKHEAGDVIKLPDQKGSLIKTSKNQYQFCLLYTSPSPRD